MLYLMYNVIINIYCNLIYINYNINLKEKLITTLWFILCIFY